MPLHFDTLQVHAGQNVDQPHRARAPPIYASTSFVFDSSKHAAQLFSLEVQGHGYSRLSNPTNDVFEQRMAALEGGVGAVSVASGQAAQFLALAALARSGDNIVSSSYLYGGTHNQLGVTFRQFGIEARFVDGDGARGFSELIDDRTRAVYFESVGNPKCSVPDFERIVEIAHKAGIPVVVDNTLGAGGYLLKPIKHGADIVVHSATKWIGGHGTTIAGVIIDSGNFPWAKFPKKYPQFSEPSESYHGAVFNQVFGAQAYIGHVRINMLRDLGPALNPFGAFLLLQGLETLSLRVERQSSNAARLALFLKSQACVKWVSYLGLPSHESHELAKKYFDCAESGDVSPFGGILSFGLKSSKTEKVTEVDKEPQTEIITEKEDKRETESEPEISPEIVSDDPFQEPAARVVDSLELASGLANVGDCKTLVIAPFFTTHLQLSDAERMKAGVTRDMVRVSVGIEHIDDIINDFKTAFSKVFGHEKKE